MRQGLQSAALRLLEMDCNVKRSFVLCEKKTQADAIASALHLKTGFDAHRGDVDGDAWVVAWASGHLLELEDPEKAKPDITWHTPESLLPVPTSPRLRISSGSQKAISRLKEAAKNCNHVIVATDPDREGEAIGRTILAYLRLDKLPTQRLWLVAGMDEESIKAAQKKLKPGHATLGMWRAQEARSLCDWQAMITTRCATMAARRGLLGQCGQGTGPASVASCGRVQTPTLRMVVERDLEIENFVPKSHFLPAIFVQQGDISGELKYAPKFTKEDALRDLPGVTWTEGEKPRPLFTNIDVAQKFLSEVNALSGTTQELVVAAKKKNKQPPLTFSLTKLQQAANKEFKLTAAQTLKATQSLYTNGYVSYPRTEHEHLPKEAYQDAIKVLTSLKTVGPAYEKSCAVAIHGLENPSSQLPRVYTSKDMEHHGIMPTTKQPQQKDWSHAEKVVYQLISQRYVEAHLPDAIIESVTVEMRLPVVGLIHEPKSTFLVKGERVIEPGWMSAFRATASKKDSVPLFTKGPSILASCSLSRDKTKPPPRYTEATLLEAMKQAGRFASGEEAKLLKSVNGIGTPATRDTILETLVSRAYIKREKSSLISTQPGRDLIRNLPDSLTSVVKTAHWEVKLGEMAMAEDQEATRLRDLFIQDQTQRITAFVNDFIPKINSAPQPQRGNRKMANAPSEKMINFARKISKETGVPTPPDVETSFDACKAYIDDNVSKLPQQSSGPRAPTEKMIAFAQKLAQQNQVLLPDGYDTDSKVCRDFLDTYAGKSNGAPRAPTDKMINAAKAIATKNNLTIEPKVLESFDECRQFLSAYMN